MSEQPEASNRHLASTTESQQQQQDICSSTAPPAKSNRRKRPSTSSNDTITTKRSTSSRSRFDINKTVASDTKPGPPYTVQQSSANPKDMSSINLTKTGRVSKAKKGLKVHDCECGRSYTRAEHLRRHQRNHAKEGAMVCGYPSCGKLFYRLDLLQRHEERHNEFGNTSRQPSVSSAEHSAHTSPTTVPAILPMFPVNTLPPTPSYPQQQVSSPQPGATPFPRYNPNLFRTPQIPRTPKVAPSNPSNYVFLSSPNFKTPTNESKHQSMTNSARHSISGPVTVESIASNAPWHDSFAPSPYSCSSGYATPAPGLDYGHAYASPPYINNVVRTRASSNASFIEQHWVQASQSPTSSAGMPYSWPSDEKSIAVSSFPYTTGSYSASDMPMYTMVPPVTHYGAYDPHNVAQMDAEEGVHLFPGDHYGMSQIMCAYPSEQWLNYYWRLFHPTFPVVHRFTFDRLELSPMLYAAMIAIDLYYSNIAAKRQKARELHKVCIKLLNQREQMSLVGCDRLCDLQAMFLVEVFAQYCAQRCFKTLSPRFDSMLEKLLSIRGVSPAVIYNVPSPSSMPEDSIEDCWVQWAKASARQHLLLSCFILEAQQYTLLARDRESTLQTMSDSLPFPINESWWGAETASEWSLIAQDQRGMPTTTCEALQPQLRGRYDTFQSAVLIAAQYGNSNSFGFNSGMAIEGLLSNSWTIQLQLLTTKLAQLLPMRALLAVSGETWIFGTKLTSEDECSALRSSLRTWLDQLWSCSDDSDENSAAEALHISISILELSLEADTRLSLGLGNELGVFFAALVLWAATAAAHSRSCVPKIPFGPLLPPHRNTSTTSQPVDSSYTATLTTYHQSVHGLMGLEGTLCAPFHRRGSVPYQEIISNTTRFLQNAAEDIATFNLTACDIGSTSVLLWAKIHLRGSFRNGQQPTNTSADASDQLNGEVINEAIGQIERMLDHGWEGWDI